MIVSTSAESMKSKKSWKRPRDPSRLEIASAVGAHVDFGVGDVWLVHLSRDHALLPKFRGLRVLFAPENAGAPALSDELGSNLG